MTPDWVLNARNGLAPFVNPGALFAATSSNRPIQSELYVQEGEHYFIITGSRTRDGKASGNGMGKVLRTGVKGNGPGYLNGNYSNNSFLCHESRKMNPPVRRF